MKASSYLSVIVILAALIGIVVFFIQVFNQCQRPIGVIIEDKVYSIDTDVSIDVDDLVEPVGDGIRDRWDEAIRDYTVTE